MSLSGITENILNKIMMDSYQTVPDNRPRHLLGTRRTTFCRSVHALPDGRWNTASLTAVGELANITLQDETYSNQLGTLGVVGAIGRDVLINDDMGCSHTMADIARSSAAIKREMDVIRTLLLTK